MDSATGRSVLSRAWLAVPVFALTVALTGAVHGSMDPRPKALSSGGVWVPRPEVAELLAMGFEPVVADLHWIRAVQIVGEPGREPSSQSEVLGRLIEVVTQLDPWVDHPYRFAAIWMTEDMDAVRHANRLLDRGIEHHPDDWRMYFYKGFNHFFYLDEKKVAADELERAMGREGSPRYLPRLVARLRSEVADLDAAAIFLHQMVESAPDEYSRAEYQSALDEIEVERAARFLERARAAYRELHGRDIAMVADLLLGEHPILRSLPPAEPTSLPADMRRGSRWEIDPATGRIVSSYYGRRYEVNFHPLEEKRRREWRVRDRGQRSARARGAAEEVSDVR